MKFTELKAKYRELKANKLTNSIEWTEEKAQTESPLNQFASSELQAPKQYMLQSIGFNHYKLYMLVNGIYVDVMVFAESDLEA